MKREKDDRDRDAPVVMQFYHSHVLPYLIIKWRTEIEQRYKDVPRSLREADLAPKLAALGETRGDPAWQVFRAYLNKLEDALASVVRRHSPSFWIHLHRRLRPMLADNGESKTDDTTVALVRRIAELAYAKHGDIARTDDLGPILQTRLESFLDGAWYEGTAYALRSKLKAKRLYQTIKWSKQVVMTDFRVDDLLDVFGIEGLCYEYWWASAQMRSIGKGAIVKWDSAKTPSLRYNDAGVHPLCFDLYDERNSSKAGFYTRLGTWLDSAGPPEKIDASSADQIHFAQLTPNPMAQEYPVWRPDKAAFGRGYGATNFGIGTFSLAKFLEQNAFMAESFAKKHGVALEAVAFAIWAASFFAVFTGVTSHLRSMDQGMTRTLMNWQNLQWRGYTMVGLDQSQLAEESVWFAKVLGHPQTFSVEDVRRGLDFITLGAVAQRNIGLWSGGKRPILIPAVGGLMIDLAAIVPFLYTIFFGLKKVDNVGGQTFEDSIRAASRLRKLDVCLQGIIRWPTGNPREVDLGIRTGNRLTAIECFSYELPLDFEVGKPSVFEKRKEFLIKKIAQAKTLAERMRLEPKGTNFDVSWAEEIDWRVVSPFVEFAWEIDETFFDERGLPRVLQAEELLDFLTDGKIPAQRLVRYVRDFRGVKPAGRWY